MRARRGLSAIAALAAFTALAAAPLQGKASTVPGCAGSASGGDWPSYSGALPAPSTPGGNRNQPAEQSITPGNVSKLGLAWKLDMPDGGLIHSTPTVADGCVFVGTDLGTVYAINADTGAVVWQNKVTTDGGSTPFTGAGIVGSPAVANGQVFVGVTALKASIEVALDEVTGQSEWATPIDTDPGGGADASPVPFDTGGGLMVFQSYQHDESSAHSNPGWAILNATSGSIVAASKIIPAAAYAAGDRGGSIVDTPAIDVDSKMLYAGTGNPASVHQNPITNAEVKIDLDPSHATFGQVIAFVRGTSDSYPMPKDANIPTCPRTRNVQWPVGPFSCDSLDFDFFSSGNLYTTSNGRQLYAELQKSGVMQAVDTRNMSVVWKRTLNIGCFFCNGGSTAADDNGIYAATTGGNLFGLNKDTGAIKWVIAGSGSYHYNGVSVANGVVYDMNDLGALEAFDASNGRPLLVHPLLTESGGPYQDGENSSGVSVARDTVYAASTKPSGGSGLFAFKLGAGSGGGLPLPSPPPLPHLGRGLTVLAGPGSYASTYWTAVVVVQAGNEHLSFTNLDLQRHNVVSDGGTLFDSDFAGLGETVPVRFHEHLQQGKVYPFFCTIHPGMFGRILAV